jgi:hypothetical protein
LWYFWILVKAFYGVCFFSPLKICGIYGIRHSSTAFSLTLLLIGLYGAHRWGDNEYTLANIYCTVKPWIQRNESYSQIKICMCIGYMVGGG